MYKADILTQNHRRLFDYSKTIDAPDKDEFCNRMGHFFLSNRTFRNHIANARNFNIFGYRLSHKSNLYIPEHFLNEQRFCAYHNLSASHINTIYSGCQGNDRPQTASHLFISLPTAHSHYNAINKYFGVQNESQAIIVVQNS